MTLVGSKSFEFHGPTKVIFGVGVAEKIPAVLKDFGPRIWLASSRSSQAHPAFQSLVNQAGMVIQEFCVPHEPTIELAQEATRQARSFAPDVVVGWGGGSAMDLAKAVGGLIHNPGNLLDYLEVIGQGKALPQAGAPIVAVPTTAGTGAEVTRNAVLGSAEHKVKVSLRGPQLWPRVAVVDPALTLGLPAQPTAFGGMDALTQLLESALSTKSSPVTWSWAKTGLEGVGAALRRVWQNPADIEARAAMALGSHLSGVCLANTGLGIVHGLAAPLGGRYAAPHGALCAALLPFAWQVNWEQAQTLPAAVQTRDSFCQLTRLLTGNPLAQPEDLTAWLLALNHDLKIPTLRQWQIPAADFSLLAQAALQANSSKTNPVTLSESQVRQILEMAW